MSKIKIFWYYAKRVFKAFMCLFFYILFFILVKIFYSDIYDAEQKLIVVNGNSFSTGELIAVVTFLFGIILTFNIHYYDQIEPKYSNLGEGQENTSDYFFERSSQIFNISMLTIINTLIVVQNFTAFRKFYFLVSAEQNLLILLFTNFTYLLICVIKQVEKWGENLRKDKEKFKK